MSIFKILLIFLLSSCGANKKKYDGEYSPITSGTPGDDGTTGSTGGNGNAPPTKNPIGPGETSNVSIPSAVLPLTYYQLENSFNAVFAMPEGVKDAVNPLAFGKEKSGYSTEDSPIPTVDSLKDFIVFTDAYMNAKLADIKAMFVQNGKACTFGSSMPEECVKSFVKTFGAKAFRRPLTNDETSQYTAVFIDQAKADPNSALEAVLVGFMMSPNHLFVSAVGANGTLTPYEKASMISFAVNEAPPDEALLGNLDKLKTSQGTYTVVQEMMEKSRKPISRFLLEHFNLSVPRFELERKDPETKDEELKKLGNALANEGRLFVTEIVTKKSPTMDTLLGSEEGYASKVTKDIYGVDGGADQPKAVQYPAKTRKGILTVPAVISSDDLASQDEPAIFRGRFIREQVLCGNLPPRPELPVENMDAAAGGGKTHRQESEARLANNQCKNCHRLMDHLGMAFENYNNMGGLKKNADSKGSLGVNDKPEIPVNNGYELAEQIQKSPDAHSCLAKMAYQYISNGYQENCDSCDIPGMLNDDKGDLIAFFSHAVTANVQRKVTKGNDQ